MTNYDYLKFCIELIGLIITEFDELELKSNKLDTKNRLHYANESLKKAYFISLVIIKNGGI